MRYLIALILPHQSNLTIEPKKGIMYSEKITVPLKPIVMTKQTSNLRRMLMGKGKAGWGDSFKIVANALIEELDKEIRAGKKINADVINKSIEKIQSEKLKFPINKSFKKEVLEFLEKCWEHGEIIDLLMSGDKI